jgi:16S rRNA processing protein RimM
VSQRVPPEGALIPVGRVGRPHGLAGAFLVESASEDDAWFTVGAALYVDGEPARVVESYRAGNRRALRLDRHAERGAELAIPRHELPPPAEDGFYVFQLVGLEVTEGDRILGRVRDVLPGAANDNLELDTGHLVPLVEDAIGRIDLDARRIELVPGFLDEA